MVEHTHSVFDTLNTNELFDSDEFELQKQMAGGDAYRVANIQNDRRGVRARFRMGFAEKEVRLWRIDELVVQYDDRGSLQRIELGGLFV